MNQCMIIGNLARDPEYNVSPKSGAAWCRMTVAVNRPFAKDGQQEADFITVVAWRNLADNCAKYLTKGRKVAVAGWIETGSYVDETGLKHFTTQINADSVEFLTPRGDRDDRA